MSTPKPGWKLADAVDLVHQGYSVVHAARVTGWPASVIEAQLKANKRTGYAADPRDKSSQAKSEQGPLREEALSVLVR